MISWLYDTITSYGVANIIVIGLLSFVSLFLITAFLFPQVILKNRLAASLWGKFKDRGEIKKFAFLAIIFGCIIGVYWGLRPLKDGIFANIVGMDWQPLAKILSLFLITPLVIVYSKLVDKYPRNKVFYILMAIYGTTALLFMLAFMHKSIGLANTVESPYRIIGWLWYVYVESFGSLIVALFWAFTSDISQPDEAKRGFPIIALLGQTGNVLGPWIFRATRFGFKTSAPVVGMLGIVVFIIGLLLWLFIKVTPEDHMVGYEAAEKEKELEKKEHKEPGFLDGLKLLLQHGYLLGIAAIIMFFEIIVTMLDFFFKITAKKAFPFETEFSAYLADYGVWTGIVATTCVILGINSIQRKLGMRASLILLPILVGAAVITLRVSPILSIAFWVMVFSKAVNYALNQPTLKQLYIPTSKDAKYKSQAWIEMFGSRGSKAIGSGINFIRKLIGPNVYVLLSATVSLGLVGVWLFVAVYIANKYDKAIENNEIVC